MWEARISKPLKTKLTRIFIIWANFFLLVILLYWQLRRTITDCIFSSPMRWVWWKIIYLVINTVFIFFSWYPRHVNSGFFCLLFLFCTCLQPTITTSMSSHIIWVSSLYFWKVHESIIRSKLTYLDFHYLTCQTGEFLRQSFPLIGQDHHLNQIEHSFWFS